MEDFLKAYTIKEVSKQIDVPEGTIRQWEKDFPKVLVIPRDEQNARYFTEFEIETLKHIRAMREKSISKKMINELLIKRAETQTDDLPNLVEPSVPVLKQSEAIQTLRDVQKALEAFPEIKKMIVSEVKSDIQNEIKNELTDVVRQEIASSLEEGSNTTSKQIETLSESLNTMEENYSNEIKRRDEILVENLRLLREVKEQKNKGFFKRLFDK